MLLLRIPRTVWTTCRPHSGVLPRDLCIRLPLLMKEPDESYSAARIAFIRLGSLLFSSGLDCTPRRATIPVRITHRESGVPPAQEGFGELLRDKAELQEQADEVWQTAAAHRGTQRTRGIASDCRTGTGGILIRGGDGIPHRASCGVLPPEAILITIPAEDLQRSTPRAVGGRPPGSNP